MSSMDYRIQPGIQLNCPACRASMERCELSSREGGFCVDRCTRCGGVWLDASELERVKSMKGQAERVDKGSQGKAGRDSSSARRALTASRSLSRILLCPRDGEHLKAGPAPDQPHVIIDRCPTCLGVYLDAGELRDLAHHTVLERVREFFSLG
ncbi:MAG: zf-TFIIB domain-containing protein [Phycisphaerales bacterium]